MNKSRDRKECIVFHCWYFNKCFKFQRSVCNSFHDKFMISLGIKNIATVTVKSIDYGCITYDFSKYDVINLLENYVLGYEGIKIKCSQRN